MHSAPGDWEKRTAVAGLLEADEMDPALEHLVGQINPPLIDPSAAGNATLEEKAALLKTWLGLDALPEVPALFPAWVPESLVDPTQLAFMQTRPTTWIRVQQQSLEKVKAICDAEKIRYQAHERLHTALAIPTAKELTQLNEKSRSPLRNSKYCFTMRRLDLHPRARTNVVGCLCGVWRKESAARGYDAR